MLKRQGTVVAALAVLATQSACYTTKVVSRAAPEGPSYTDRQWFTVGGLAGLSQPAGQHCENGIAWTESKLSGTDWLINAGLTVAGGIAGTLACGGYGGSGSLGQSFATLYCGSIGASLVPFLLSSRTVEYTCAQGPAYNDRPAYMPPPTGNRAPAPAPEQQY
ncbi:MAG TPA: hypothetical protein VEZ71_06975 [Archangium sp.]|nr:hypothetical protein [Archangium sp.]